MSIVDAHALAVIGIAVTCLMCGCAAAPGGASSLAANTDAWHAERLDKLQAPDGWLSLVALEWLQPGVNRIGRGPDADVRYDGFPVDQVGAIVLEGDVVAFETAPGVSVEGAPADGVLQSDATGAPTVLGLGDIRFHVIRRSGRLAVRIKDAAAPTRTGFAGIERYPADERWRIEAAFTPAADGATLTMDTVLGMETEAGVSGRARFEYDGVEVDAVLMDAGDGGSMLRFADATSGDATYGAGRYLYIEPSADGGAVVLDFNRAFNPPCAFTPYGTCTLPPDSNRFPFPVTAGERWRSGD